MKKSLFLLGMLFLTLNHSYAQTSIFGIKIPSSSRPKGNTKTNESPQTTITNTIGSVLGSSGGMTQGKAAEGLKMALNTGTDYAANNLGVVDGFLKNEAVKILFPPEAKKIENTMRQLGLGKMCDQFIASVNHAAEKAVVEAKPIFSRAITSMTINDAIGILTGGENSATSYLKNTSGVALNQAFEPIIKTELDRANATKYWSEIVTRYNQIPLVQKVNPNLSQYVTEKASDGIFLMVAREEKKIRENPAGQASKILQDVFGWAKNRTK